MSPGQAAPWEQDGWSERARVWVNNTVERLGLSLRGLSEQFHIRPWSTVPRVPTSGGDLFFKATLPGLAHEAGLTLYLASQWPHLVPQVYAVD
jgi:hypothetical protein